MENNETWKNRFAEQFVINEKICCHGDYCNNNCAEETGKEIEAFIAAELLTLADKIGAEKIRPDAAMYIAEASSVKTKNAPFDSGFDFGCRTALDTAISVIKEMVK